VVVLGEVRRALAWETGYAADLVFPYASSTALVARLPRTMADLEGIPGLGPKWIEAYGAPILQAICTALGTTGPVVPLPPQPPIQPDVGQLVTLLEQAAAELRGGRAQLAPASSKTVLRDVSSTGVLAGRPMV